MKLGSLDITDLKIGTTEINEVRLGSVLVWERGGGVDADAQAFLTAAGITDPTISSAINTLVVSLKANGLWTKMKAIYPFVGGTATTHKYNLKNPLDTDAAFRLVFNGGWTHSSTGALPNGTNGYADTKIIPSVVTTLNDESLGFNLRTNNVYLSVDPVTFGAFRSILQASLLTSSFNLSSRLNGSTVGVYQPIKNGFCTASKFSSSITKVYKNGSSIASGTSGGSLPNINMFLGNLNLNGTPYASGWTNDEFSFAFYAKNTTDTDNSNLYTAVTTFNTALSR